MIEIRKAYTSRMTWAQLKAGVKDSTVPLYAGDEIDITLKTGENVTLVCERIRDGRATFFTKDLLEDTHAMDSANVVGSDKSLSSMDRYLKKLFRLLPDDLQEVAGSLRLLKEQEIFGENWFGKPEGREQFVRYKNQANRVKRLSGVPFPYWLSTTNAGNFNGFCFVNANGMSNMNYARYSYGVCFGFDI